MNNLQNIICIIMDGYGLRAQSHGNAIKAAHTPNLDKLFANFPNTTLSASGLAVGLPEGQMGNSEVGHTNIGAGRVVYQELTRISKEIKEGAFFHNKTLVNAIREAKDSGHALHLMGLLSDGGVHSHNTHLYALLKLAKKFDLHDVYIHCFLDGRDVAPQSGLQYIMELEQELQKIGVGKIATISGRYYAMDRDNRYQRVQKAYDAVVLLQGNHANTAQECVRASYAQGVTDEFVIPCVIGTPHAIAAGDSVVFYNFRPDRAREITRALCDPQFDGFVRAHGYFQTNYVCMTCYDANIPNVSIAYLPQGLDNTLGEYISKKQLTQLRIAETEKYAHVTFFFNGGVETPYPGEDRVLIASPKVATYDLQPEMSAYPVTDEVVSRIGMLKYNLIVLNFANCDMVGHTGRFDAAIKAVETVDVCIGRVIDAAQSNQYTCIITADHGNSDKMFDDDDAPFTAHTTNLVPFIVTDETLNLRSGSLCDIAPTILQIMGLPIPKDMTGESLIQ